MQEKKKIIPQPVAQQDNFYVARPSSSSRNRSINGGYGSASPLNRKLSRGFSNNTSYTSLGTSLRRESSGIIKNTWPQTPTVLLLGSLLRDENRASVVLYCLLDFIYVCLNLICFARKIHIFSFAICLLNHILYQRQHIYQKKFIYVCIYYLRYLNNVTKIGTRS